jgi:hypothetical protein
MEKKDIRAVENPISAIFDLAEDVNAQAPKMKKMMKYVTIFVSIWLFLDFLFMVAINPVSFPFLILLFFSLFSLRWVTSNLSRLALIFLAVVMTLLTVILLNANILIGALLTGLFVLGIVVLNLNSELKEFFEYYLIRHRAIKSVRDEDPVVYVPKGESAVDRLMSYLSFKNPQVRELQRRADYVQKPAILKGGSGVLYNFDCYVKSSASALWRTLGIGNPGYALYIKNFEVKPRLKDLQALKTAVEDISMESKIPASRVIGLWRSSEDETIDDDLYEFLTGKIIEFRFRGNSFHTTMELITEKPDGTYDFIPFISEGVY